MVEARRGLSELLSVQGVRGCALLPTGAGALEQSC